MNLGPYRLLAQIGAGRDGVAYRACQATGGKLAEVRVLDRACSDPERWARLTRRLRCNTFLKHPSARRILHLDLQGDPPYSVLDAVEGNCAARLWEQGASPDRQTIMRVGLQLAEVLCDAHRLGIVHGAIHQEKVIIQPDGGPLIDLTSFETGAPAGPLGGFQDSQFPSRVDPPGLGIDDAAVDVQGLGNLLAWLMSKESNLEPATSRYQDAIGELIAQMQAADPTDRPTMTEVAARLGAMLSAKAEQGSPIRTSAVLVPEGGGHADLGLTMDDATIDPDAAASSCVHPPEAVGPTSSIIGRSHLGRFRLLNKLGEGGMGAVYRAEDITDGTKVAIKILRPESAARPPALKRFLKEARLLAEVNSPNVANLLEVNEDGGIHYLVIEFVEGQSLDKLLESHGFFEERKALEIIADVARGLAIAHQHGIVHRDVKPENVLVQGQLAKRSDEQASSQPGIGVSSRPLIKLSDFGLARHIVETESLNLTRAGTILGTPLYMPPEQCSGGSVGPQSDVYSLGATLFHLLTGRPPFTADSALGLIAKHSREPAPSPRQFRPDLSDGVCQLVGKCLEKSPDSRYADAGAFLQDVERLLRGEPTGIVLHPALPRCDPGRVLHYDWTWELEAAPDLLWPHVSNTERLNRAAGLPAVSFSTESAAGHAANNAGLMPAVKRYGQFRKVGMLAAWQEHPFEWIEGRRFGVLREYSQGPFKWLVSIVELTPRPEGGTLLAHRVRIEPHSVLGRTVAAVEVGIKGRRAVDRIYRRIDAAVTGKLGAAHHVDPFEGAQPLPSPQQRRLDRLLEELSSRGTAPEIVEALGDFLAHGPDQDVARIRPLALARRLGLPPHQVAAACLHGANIGLLVLLWDLLCPMCRIPSEVKDTLRALRDHGHCDACNLDYELDFANSVEMIFRVHPEIRRSEVRTYCIGGPAHFPHVVAQVRIAARERMDLDLALPEGPYRLRGPQLPYVVDLEVRAAANPRQYSLDLLRGPDSSQSRALQPRSQLISLLNDHTQELVVRIERLAQRADALTAARAAALPLFRELFPGEVLSPGQLVSVSTVTFLATALDQASSLYEEYGDVKAFGMIHEQFRVLNEEIKRVGGAVVKTVGEGILAAFHDAIAAIRTAMELPRHLQEHEATRYLRFKAAVNRGPAMAATLNDQLDYFGSTVNDTWRLVGMAETSELILADSLGSDPQIASLLKVELADAKLVAAAGTGLKGLVGYRIAGRPGASSAVEPNRAMAFEASRS